MPHLQTRKFLSLHCMYMIAHSTTSRSYDHSAQKTPSFLYPEWHGSRACVVKKYIGYMALLSLVSSGGERGVQWSSCLPCTLLLSQDQTVPSLLYRPLFGFFRSLSCIKQFESLLPNSVILSRAMLEKYSQLAGIPKYRQGSLSVCC